MNRTDFFITGTFRSGTTLLDKLLQNHPQVSTLSQPAPALFIGAKKAFLQAQRLDIPYQILNDYFQHTAYRPEAFTSFLQAFRFTAAQLAAINHEIKAFQRQNPIYTPIEPLKNEPNATLAHLYRQLLAVNLAAEVRGSKEVIGEEFLPYLLLNNLKSLLVLRDPRDVVASTYFGKGETYAGSPRPFIWMIRNWRKSVAFALHLRQQAGLLTLTYEKLVQQPAQTLSEIARFLNLDPFPEDFLQQPLRQQNGELWHSNSSYNQTAFISPGSVGGYRQQLPPALQAYVETVCFPEMKLLGYAPELSQPDLASIENFREPFLITRPGIDPHFSARTDVKAAEIFRLQLLQKTNPERSEIQRYFIFEEAYQALRK